MAKKPGVITGNVEFKARFREMTAGDIVFGRVRLRPSEEHILFDLSQRGVRFVPSALAQLASRSKTFQTLLFSEYMAPRTMSIHDIHELIEAMVCYRQEGIGQVVTKLDRRDGGRGVHLWNSVEEVYNQASLGVLLPPFVLQPYFPECRDSRVIILGDYIEVYRRHNPWNFRHNLHFGGRSEKTALTQEQAALCRQIMHRGQFPYAHLDLMEVENGPSYLNEINLRGGIRGATITPDEYRARVSAIDQKILAAMQAEKNEKSPPA